MDSVTKRLRSTVCNRYNESLSKLNDISFFGVPTRLDDGNCTLTPSYRTEDMKFGLYTLNYLRWLTGFSTNVQFDYTNNDAECDCASYMYYNGVTNFPRSETDICYSKSAAQGCQTSLVTGKVKSTAAAVMHNYRDIDDNYLGHRMWLFSKKFGYTSFCGSGENSAIKVIGNKEISADNIPFIASPPPGPCPKEFWVDNWTFLADGLTTNAEIHIYVNGKEVGLKEANIYNWGNFQTKYLKFVPDTQYMQTTTYEVAIYDEDREYSYSIYTTDCTSSISDAAFDDLKVLDSRERYLRARSSRNNFYVGSALIFLTLIIIIFIIVLIYFDKKTKELLNPPSPKKEPTPPKNPRRRSYSEPNVQNTKRRRKTTVKKGPASKGPSKTSRSRGQTGKSPK